MSGVRGEREVRGQAVVCGASMAGLLAARVLAEFYDTVIVVERDELPDDAAQRRGVGQRSAVSTRSGDRA